MERIPIRRARHLAELDQAEILEGYRDGLNSDPEPGNNRSFSYWHGWRNGAVDRGLRTIDEAQRELACDIVKSTLFASA
jgi:hypothetical protein